jgi:hypothetical protein
MLSEMTATATGFCCGGNGVGPAMFTVMLAMCSQILVRSVSNGVEIDSDFVIQLTTVVTYQALTRLLPSSLWSTRLLPSWTRP